MKKRKILAVIMVISVFMGNGIVSAYAGDKIPDVTNTQEVSTGTVLTDASTSTPVKPDIEEKSENYEKDGFSYVLLSNGTARVCAYYDNKNSNDSIYIPFKINYNNKEYSINNDDYLTNVISGMVTEKKIIVDDDNPYYSAVDGNLFNKDKTSLIKVSKCDSDNYNVLDGVQNIWAHAFTNTNIKSINIPQSVMFINPEVFSRCTALNKITIDSKNHNYKVDDSLLYNMSESVLDYPNNLSVVCSFGNAKSIKVQDGIENISYFAFRNNKSVEKIELPDSIKHIERDAFKGCSNLKTLIIQNKDNMSVAPGAFDDCMDKLKITCNGTETPVKDFSFNGDKTVGEESSQCGDAGAALASVFSLLLGAGGVFKLKRKH